MNRETNCLTFRAIILLLISFAVHVLSCLFAVYLYASTFHLQPPPAHHSQRPSHFHWFITGSKLTFSTNLFHQSASTHLDCLLELYWTGLTLLNGFSFLVIFFLFLVVRYYKLA